MGMNTVIHIGFPKTGTTTHQIHLFDKHSQIVYLGKPYKDSRFEQEIHGLIKQESTIYDSSALKEYMNSVNKEEPGKNVLLVSDEIMVSLSKVRDKGVVAQRIKEVFFPCKILITIRDQVEMLKSAYINGGRLLTHVPGKYRGRYVPLEDWLIFQYEYLDRSHMGNFIYFNTIQYYEKLFGKENILVLLFEEFLDHPDQYINKLSRFLDIDKDESLELLGAEHENVRIDQSRLEFERWVGSRMSLGKSRFLYRLSKVYGYFSHFLAKNRKAKVVIPGHWLERLRDVYSQGNRELMQLLDLPLEQYGYLL